MKLSICIATYKRGAFIAATLDTILPQVGPDVEVVVVDGASPDDTSEVVGRYVTPDGPLRYIRETENSGVDRDYDKAVGYARGEYCWLMTDDDLMAEHAVERVLEAIADGPDLVVVNAEMRDATLARTLLPALMETHHDHAWGPDDTDVFFAEAANCLSFIGSVVVRRNVWLSRARAPYYGTLFIHVGVIFQQPALARVKIVAEPLIIIRYGNAMWTPRGFEIWTIKWPGLVWSFAHVAAEARAEVCHPELWRNPRVLLYYRAIGSYSREAWREHLAPRLSGPARWLSWAIAALPVGLANVVSVAALALRAKPPALMLYDLLRIPQAEAVSRPLARFLRRYR